MASSAIQELIQDVDNQLNGSITIVGKIVIQLYIFDFGAARRAVWKSPDGFLERQPQQYVR